MRRRKSKRISGGVLIMGENQQNLISQWTLTVLLELKVGFVSMVLQAQVKLNLVIILTQMERYEGVFVCSTNLMDGLDTASLRRFDLKIKFDFMRLEQAWDLFEAIFADKGIELTHKKHWQEELEKQRTLTPGDFATVVQKSRISGLELTPDAMLSGLAEEVAFKGAKAGRDIGFFAEK